MSPSAPQAGMTPQQMAQRVIDRVPPKLLLRVIPKRIMTGQLGPPHRPYVCMADYEELQGLAIREVINRIYNGFKHNLDDLIAAYPDAPFYDTKSYLFGEDHIDGVHSEIQEQEFYIFAIRPGEALDCVPATWKAMGIIATDHERFPVTHIVDALLTEHGGQRPLNVKDILGSIDYYEFKNFEDEREVVRTQWNYHDYLRIDAIGIYNIMELFGTKIECWHGCGYIGPGFHILSRVFFGKNLPISHDLVYFCRLMSLEDILPVLDSPDSTSTVGILDDLI
ncbi:hypothetical protein [Deinococcus navajonensis]|uniref:Uncharacterized protein n=1 Tax=Deinococcus navajonensis TaxID=309884 RepID=A0ABV8XNN3_9DEIO